MILQLNPTIPLTTPHGRAIAHFLIDNGDEHHLLWVCIQDDTGEIWVWPNPDVRGRPNPTMGRKINGTADRIAKLETALQWIIEQKKQTAHPTVCEIVKTARKALDAE